LLFGKIDYLNLLPFYVYMKRSLRHSKELAALNYKKGVPSQINSDYKARKIDAAFISSIASRSQHCQDVGIIANKKVLSVILIPGNNKIDKESASSNALANILGLSGEVLIGDKALRYALKNSNYIDLAEEWYKKYKLPFVFARLCCHKPNKKFAKTANKFANSNVKIPTYILRSAAIKNGISIKEVKSYLELIKYQINPSSKRALNKFFSLLHNKSLF